MNDSHAKPVQARQPIGPENYVPPPRLLRKLLSRGIDANGSTTVTMPLSAFTKLLEAALAPAFDESRYLASHTDVKAGVESGAIPSGLRHFATHGFFEGRSIPDMSVDAAWYLSTYPDVQQAIDNGQVGDAAHHFEVFGYQEGRVPNERFQATIGEWQNLAAREPGTGG